MKEKKTISYINIFNWNFIQNYYLNLILGTYHWNTLNLNLSGKDKYTSPRQQSLDFIFLAFNKDKKGFFHILLI